MSQLEPSSSTGHRARLRQRLAADPAALSAVELLELLLTFAIPRLDVTPQARALLGRFGSPAGVLAASYRELLETAGIGEHHAYLPPTIFTADTPLGPYQGVTDQVEMSQTPGRYRTVLVPRGSSRPEWLPRDGD